VVEAVLIQLQHIHQQPVALVVVAVMQQPTQVQLAQPTKVMPEVTVAVQAAPVAQVEVVEVQEAQAKTEQLHLFHKIMTVVQE
jgi:hypothetical protein